MPRRYRPAKREVTPDLKYNSQIIQRFINRMMHSGKKSTAQRVIYRAFDIVVERAQKPAMQVFEDAMANLRPAIEITGPGLGSTAAQAAAGSSGT